MPNIIYIFSSGLQQGLIWAILVIGVYISFRILDIADLSVEGTFPLGAVIAGLCVFKGVNPFLATFLAFVGGLGGGFLTGVLHTKFKIPAILSGIITMTALSSLNLVILGFASSSSAILASKPFDVDVFSIVSGWLQNIDGLQKQYANILSVVIVGAFFLAIVVALVYWLFGTQIGMAVRATGNNEKMARAQGINTDKMIILGLMFSNGLLALSGALFAQNLGAANVDSGRGAIVIGLAAIIIGEIIFGRKTFKRSLVSIIVGSIIFFIIKAVAIYLRVDHYLNFLVAVLIAIILAFPLIKPRIMKWFRKKERVC